MSGSSLNNLPVEVNDVSNSSVIFGSNHNRLRRVSTAKPPKRVKEEYLKIPKYLYQLHKCGTLTADVTFVNGISFLVTFSRNIIFLTTKYAPTSTSGQLSKYLMNIVKLYARGGFVTCLACIDVIFEMVKKKLS